MGQEWSTGVLCSLSESWCLLLVWRENKSQFCSSVAFQRCVCDAALQESRALFGPPAVLAMGARQGPPLQSVGQGLNEGPGRDSLTEHRDGEKTKSHCHAEALTKAGAGILDL